MRRLFAPGILLWMEAAGLGLMAVQQGQWWLMPLAAAQGLLAALLSRGISLALPAAVALPLLWALLWQRGAAGIAPPAASFAIFFLLAGTVCAFSGILAGLSRTGGAPELRGDRLCRLAVILNFLTGAVLLAGRHLELPSHFWLAWGTSILTLSAALDTLVRWLVRLYTPRRHWASLAAPGDFFFLPRPAVLTGSSPETPLIPEDENFTPRLQEMWMWPSIRRALPALLSTALLLTWLATGLHEIRAGSLGVRHRCGAWEAQNLQPGLHTSLPWPFGGVRQLDTSRITETILGFRADPGRPILWERNHYDDEQKSLVGSGDDFLSISVPVLHRIEDPAAWLRSSNDPDQLLKTIADRVLLQLTLHRPASELMTTAREPLRARFQAQLQAELDAQASGLRVVEVLLRDIHPPVEVAPSYQEVVGALEEKEAFLYGGEEYRRDVLTRAKGDAGQVVITAGATATNRLSRARGEVARFASQESAYREATGLYVLREGFKTLDSTLGGAKKVIFDKELRGAIPTHLDLRKVLNPDLVDTSPPGPQSLVPPPRKSGDAFDLDIEGLLRTDRGEIPAVNVRADDSDNLLNPEPSSSASSPASAPPSAPAPQ